MTQTELFYSFQTNQHNETKKYTPSIYLPNDKVIGNFFATFIAEHVQYTYLQAQEFFVSKLRIHLSFQPITVLKCVIQ